MLSAVKCLAAHLQETGADARPCEVPGNWYLLIPCRQHCSLCSMDDHSKRKLAIGEIALVSCAWDNVEHHIPQPQLDGPTGQNLQLAHLRCTPLSLSASTTSLHAWWCCAKVHAHRHLCTLKPGVASVFQAPCTWCSLVHAGLETLGTCAAASQHVLAICGHACGLASSLESPSPCHQPVPAARTAALGLTRRQGKLRAAKAAPPAAGRTAADPLRTRCPHAGPAPPQGWHPAHTGVPCAGS